VSEAGLSRTIRIIVLTTLALLAFAGNSVLCRLALKGEVIGAEMFTSVRLIAGALALWAILVFRGGQRRIWHAGSWKASCFLALYMIAFSVAYLRLNTGVGALILFGAVQVTMLGAQRGERLGSQQVLGVLLAMGGLVWLLAPGSGAPVLWASVVMAAAGMAWGGYTLCGKGIEDPLLETAGNFVRALPVALLLAALGWSAENWNAEGLILATASGVITSALGYAIWYEALRYHSSVRAAVLQLLVPVLASLGGLFFGSELLTAKLIFSSLLVLGGVGLVLHGKASVHDQ